RTSTGSILEERLMKIGSIVLLGLYVAVGATAQQTTSACEHILQWNSQIAARRATIARLMKTLSEEHPDAVHMRRGLASLEASRAVDVEQVRSQGLSCSSAVQSKTAGTSSKKADATRSER